jgi:hypothetical protein
MGLSGRCARIFAIVLGTCVASGLFMAAGASASVPLQWSCFTQGLASGNASGPLGDSNQFQISASGNCSEMLSSPSVSANIQISGTGSAQTVSCPPDPTGQLDDAVATNLTVNMSVSVTSGNAPLPASEVWTVPVVFDRGTEYAGGGPFSISNGASGGGQVDLYLLCSPKTVDGPFSFGPPQATADNPFNDNFYATWNQ